MSDAAELDQRILGALSGRAKLDALLADLGFPTVRSVADAFNEAAEDVGRCLSGSADRLPTMHRIRTKLSNALDLKRPMIDDLLGGALPDLPARDPSPFD